MGGSIIVAVDWNGSGKKIGRMNSMNSFEQMEAVIAQRGRAAGGARIPATCLKRVWIRF